MKRKRKAVVFLAVLFAASLCLAAAGGSVRAENTKNIRYYYSQLSAEAKPVYDAMYKMYEQGTFKTGTGSYDLVVNGHMTKEELASYEGNYDGLLKAFGAARDAFYADYPDIFYVDFSALSITVEGNGNTGYTAYLGAGENGTYFTKGFTDRQEVETAAAAHEAKINSIAGEAKKAGTVKEQVTLAHNAVIKGTVYRGENNCSVGNAGHIRTSYGALVKGESLCEGYARALKCVLDSMGVESVLVQGYYKETDGSENLHMWNYVKIDGMWYAVDATTNDGMDGTAQAGTYLLAEAPVMKEHHLPDGVMSPGGFKFTYPVLAGEGGGSFGTGDIDSEGYKTVFDKDGLRVGYKDGMDGSHKTGIFKVSYKGMGYEEAVRKEGVYILSRFYQYMPGTGEDEQGNWGYSDPKPFMMPQLKDALVLENSNSRYIEFAVTKVAPKGPLYGDGLTAEDLERNWNFQGTEGDFILSTGKLENPNGNFVPSPWAKKLTPGGTGYLMMGNTYSVRVEFNEDLEEYDGQKAGYKLTVKDGASALDHCRIENFKWDGGRTITFDFTPSKMWADNYARYDFQITGLRGKGSWKVPDVFSYYVKGKISVCAFRPQGYYFNVFAKPELLEPEDLSCKGWELASGKKLEDEVSNVTIVASKPVLEVSEPDKEQTKDMLEQIKKKGDTVRESATYNIDLKMCNKSIVKTGSSIRMSVGFPEGYGADTEGVTYKAYHFIKENGKIVDVEEIDCVVTQYGLVIACKSFSPYAVAAVAADKPVESVRKVLMLNSAGGEILGDKIRRLEKDKSQTVELKAKDGYCISSISLAGKELPVTDKKSMNVELTYNGLSYDENIMEVIFAGEEKQEASARAGSSGNAGGSSSSGSSEKKQESAQAPASGQAAPPAAADTPKAPAAQKKQTATPVTPSGSQNRNAGQEETQGYEEAALAEESGGEDPEEAENESVSRPTAELKEKKTTDAYGSGETEGDISFWLIFAAILGVGALGMAGMAVAHSIKKFD